MLGCALCLTYINKAMVVLDMSGQEHASEEGLHWLKEDGGEDNA